MLNKIIEQSKIDHFTKWFDRAENIVIVSHVAPDGDAIGSSLGLWHFFESQGKNANVIVPNAFPDFLKWMPGSKDILLYENYKEFATKLLMEADVICCLDFNTLFRIEEMGNVVAASPARKILIDHHLEPDDFARITISHPEISSTSELVFRLICRMGYFEELTKEGAECIYTGMMTDTGGFTYNSNNQQIYYIISELLSKGIDKDAIYRKVYNTYSECRLRLMGYVLSTMKYYKDYNAALISLTQEEQQRFNYVKGDSEGFVNIPLSIKDVVFSCFLREDRDKNMIKISFRSVGSFPTNKVATEFFNGGGHLNASGGEFDGSMEEAVALFEKALKAYEPLLKVKS
ncbi:MAG: bifunctional oligoribonuclease/PAP phosphatase NrnA [Bacteroides sp.]|nr:bifunctional oligoribonuclease/PAP phosphatase NrnA [Bacteroides sp.]